MAEYVGSHPGASFPISPLAAAIESMIKAGLKPGSNRGFVGDWDIIIDTIRGTIRHAVYMP
jgi:hypothetical protein